MTKQILPHDTRSFWIKALLNLPMLKSKHEKILKLTSATEGRLYPGYVLEKLYYTGSYPKLTPYIDELFNLAHGSIDLGYKPESILYWLRICVDSEKVTKQEMPKIIEFAKEIGAEIGIQNFLSYSLGRNPVKPMPFDEFYCRLREWEKRYSVKLIKSAEDFNIIGTKPLPKPFRKDEIIEAEIMCRGRLPHEMIAAAKGRSISAPNCFKEKGRVRLRITRTKHNVFIGNLV